jgi:hypothetical protein
VQPPALADALADALAVLLPQLVTLSLLLSPPRMMLSVEPRHYAAAGMLLRRQAGVADPRLHTALT